MNSVIYVKSDIMQAYDEDNIISRIKDRFKISLEGESFIKDLSISVSRVKLPPNFNNNSYIKNMEIVKRYGKKNNICLAPKTYRKLDYPLLNLYQKKLLGYSVVKSIQLMLRLKNKSIKNSCIVIYNADNYMNKEVILELAKVCKYFILLSKDIMSSINLRDYITANYGVSPVVTNDYKYAIEKADFIITPDYVPSSKGIPMWYLDNKYVSNDFKNNIVNDVTYKTPWESNSSDMSIELIGAILSFMDQKHEDIGETLKYNGIFVDKIMLNNHKEY